MSSSPLIVSADIEIPFVTATAPGCLDALGGDTTKFLSGDGVMRVPAGSAAHGFQVFYSSGTFIAQVTGPHYVRVVGGGSGGGGGSKGGGKGGGSGADVPAVVNLTAGDVVTVTVGTAGAPGTGVSSGWGNMSTSGGASYFDGVAASGGPLVHGGTPTVDSGTGATPGGTGMGMGGGPGADANGTDGGNAGGFGAGGGGGGGNPSGTGGNGGLARSGVVTVSW